MSNTKGLAKPGFYDFKYWDEISMNFKQGVSDKELKVIGNKLIGFILNLRIRSNKNEFKSYLKLLRIIYGRKTEKRR